MTENHRPEEVSVPALVGRREAAGLLGIKPENLYRIADVPKPLQDRRIRGFAVSSGPLWPRVEIEALAKRVRAEKRKRDATAKRAKARRLRESERRRMRRRAGKGTPSASARNGG